MLRKAISFMLITIGLGIITMTIYSWIFLMLTGISGLCGIYYLERYDKEQKARHNAFIEEQRGIYENRLSKKFEDNRIGGTNMKRQKIYVPRTIGKKVRLVR